MCSPFFTWFWFAATVGVSILGRFGLLNPYYLTLMYEHEPLKNFQLWRPVTALFYYPLTQSTGFRFFTNCMLLLIFSGKLEEEIHDEEDYFIMLIFNWILCVATGYITSNPMLMDIMVLSVVSVWSQLHENEIVTIGPISFKATYLPWVLFNFNFFIFKRSVTEIGGFLVGHLYFSQMYKYTQHFDGVRTPSVPKSEPLNGIIFYLMILRSIIFISLVFLVPRVLNKILGMNMIM